MKNQRTKTIVEECFELMESEGREQGFKRADFLAEILAYEGKLDSDSVFLQGQIDLVLDRECICVNDEDCGHAYYGKLKASVENIELASQTRVATAKKIMQGATTNGAKQWQVSELVAAGMAYFEAETLVNKTFGA